MAGKKSDAESFASRWANKGNENQDTQRFWIDFYQNVLGVEVQSRGSSSKSPSPPMRARMRGISTSSYRRLKPSSNRSRWESTSPRRRRARAAR